MAHKSFKYFAICNFQLSQITVRIIGSIQSPITNDMRMMHALTACKRGIHHGDSGKYRCA